MNNKFDTTSSIKTGYEGNGWSKYQLMVLQQLDDHNKVLQNLNKEVVDMKQNMAVTEAEQKMWKSQIMQLSEDITEKMDHILYDDKGVAKRVSVVEKFLEVEERSTLKVKAVWALIGAIIVFIAEIAARIVPAVLNAINNYK
jgi:hypothetical protein